MEDLRSSALICSLMELIDARKFADARTIILEQNVVDIAECIDGIEDPAKVLFIFRLMPKEMAAEVFAYLDPDAQQRIVEGMTDRELTHMLEELFLDDTVDFLEEMPAGIVKRVLKLSDSETRQHINRLLKYPEDSAGSLMTIEMMELKKGMTVLEAIRAIRRQSSQKESLSSSFVTTPDRKLEGVVDLHDILASRDETVIEDIMESDVIAVHTHDDQAEVAMLFKKYDLLAMPVVDNERRLVGIITIDDVVDVIEEENTEDIYRMAAVTPDDETYLKSGVLSIAKNRFIWLLILMVSSTITSFIIRSYEEALATLVVLTAYIPMLMNTGGNAGSQASTMVIRGLSLGEMDIRDVLTVIWKEFRVGIICGVGLSGFNFARLIFLDRLDPLVALAICSTLLCTVIIAKLCGGILPLVAKRVGVDPAIMAAPLITTIVDAVSLSIYFALATMFLL
jgi:magnesium transporter